MRQLIKCAAIAIVCCPALSASAQTENEGARLWELFALAEFPLVRRRDSVRYPAAPISEYKRLRDWVQDSGHGNTGPEYFDLVAVAYAPDEFPIDSIKLELTRDRKIGEFQEPETGSPELAREQAIWEGPFRIETTTIAKLDGKTGTYVWFGPFSADELWQDLVIRDLWPWEVRYEVILRCDGCPSPSATAGASFTMTPAPPTAE